MKTACASFLVLACGITFGVDRVRTFEDIFGDTGNSFQGAIGFVNFEGTAANPASSSYGLAIDDMYVEWREFTREPDVTSCATGSCAVVEVATTNVFDGNVEIPMTVLESSPYGRACVGGTEDGRVCYAADPGPCISGGGSCLPAGNDCDLDGSFDGPADDHDCDDDGVEDVVLRATSEIDLDGVIVVCNRVSTATYRCAVTVSRLIESEDRLLIGGNQGDDPTVTLTYLDHEDGTGHPCQNDVVVENHGLVRTATTVFLPTCDLVVTDTAFVDNGDGDSFADTDETLDLTITVRNDCDVDLTGCVARVASSSPYVECIAQPQTVLGAIPRQSEVTAVTPFRLKISSGADRGLLGLTPEQGLSATLDYRLACNEIDSVDRPQSATLTLDLNLSDLGQASTDWLESFEGTTPIVGDLTGNLAGSAFSAANLDDGIPGNNNAEGLSNADGWRCQYADPSWVLAGSYGQSNGLNCFPGLDQTFPGNSSLAWWNATGERAMVGTQSMYYGVDIGGSLAGEYTTPVAALEAAESSIINLGVGQPELSFWHQVTLADHRFVAPMPPRRNADRGVVQIQLVDEAGEPAAPWANLQPIQNTYDEQAFDGFFACTFDPVDDGTTEDDYFDPTDPTRRFGPSSTCFPEFTYGYQGDTDDPPNVTNIGNAIVPPNFPLELPDHGPGTWVQVVVDLEEFRGRRARIRFLTSSIKSNQPTWEDQFETNPDPRDDGWWVDEVLVQDVLANPAVLENDDYELGTCSGNGEACIARCEATLAPCVDDGDCGVAEECLAPCPAGQACSGPAPECGPVCTSVTATLSVTTAAGTSTNPGFVPTAAPGQVVSFDGKDSFADSCATGGLENRFCISGDPDGGGPALADTDCGDPLDTVIRGWTENFELAVAPLRSDRYVMEVRCSSAPACADVAVVDVDVECPGAANALGLADLRAVDPTTITWAGPPLAVDVWTSDEVGSGELTGYPGNLTTPGSVNAISLGPTPSPGSFRAYLVKADGPLIASPDNASVYHCNSRTWRSGGTAEIPEAGGSYGPGRDASIGSP